MQSCKLKRICVTAAASVKGMLQIEVSFFFFWFWRRQALLTAVVFIVHATAGAAAAAAVGAAGARVGRQQGVALGYGRQVDVPRAHFLHFAALGIYVGMMSFLIKTF